MVGQLAEREIADDDRPEQRRVFERRDEAGFAAPEGVDHQVMTAGDERAADGEFGKIIGVEFGPAKGNRDDTGDHDGDRGHREHGERVLGLADAPCDQIAQTAAHGAGDREQECPLERVGAGADHQEHAEEADGDGGPATPTDTLTEDERCHRGDEQRSHEDCGDGVGKRQVLQAGDEQEGAGDDENAAQDVTLGAVEPERLEAALAQREQQRSMATRRCCG